MNKEEINNAALKTADEKWSGSIPAVYISGFNDGAEWVLKQSPWISIKDKLPDTQDNVLVDTGKGGEQFLAHVDFLHSSRTVYWVLQNGESRMVQNSDHYMPIPPLPRKGAPDKSDKTDKTDSTEKEKPKVRHFLLTFIGGTRDGKDVSYQGLYLDCEKLTKEVFTKAEKECIRILKEEHGLDVPVMNLINSVELED